MPRLELFPFCFRDPLTGKWVRARYLAERHEIAERYAEWEITGPPEIREADPNARYFNSARDERTAGNGMIGNVGPFIAALRPMTRRWFAIVGASSEDRTDGRHDADMRVRPRPSVADNGRAGRDNRTRLGR